MFEVKKRAATARSGILTGDGWTMDTPNVLGVDTERFPALVHSEALLKKVEGGTKVFTRENGIEVGAFTIPAYSGIPATFQINTCQSPGPVSADGVCVIRSDTASSEIVPLRKETDVFVLENALEIYQNSRTFIDQMVRIREAVGYQSALYLPGVALPNNIAVLSYVGADIVDSTRAALLSAKEYFLTCDGSWTTVVLRGESCSCAACVDSNPGRDQLLRHNMLALHSELHRVRARIARGDLREFVEYRAKTSPKLVEMVRHLDLRFYNFQEERFPVVSVRFRATTRLSVERPDVLRFRNRMLNRYSKPPSLDILVLLPCSARKPYSESKSHGLFRRTIRDSGMALRVHEMVVTSPLGLVPRELELFYPAQHYDIPVTGHWYEDERKMINDLIKELVKNNDYSTIINHVDEDLIESIDAVCTLSGRATSDESLEMLGQVLSDIEGDKEDTGWKKRTREEMTAIARFQFGKVAGEMFEGSTVKGRFPQLRVFKDKVQVASLSPGTGQIIPTMEGAEFLASNEIYCVNIHDFELEGNLFAIGVESASPDIRVGDEVVVCRGGKAVATGTAKMSAPEMTESERGEAVRIRHRKK